jgi:ATPase subunit of ABC transporter with duplicated ATPase domains
MAAPAMSASTVVRVRELTKTHDQRVDVEELDLDVRAGEVVGVTGAHGARKTNTVERPGPAHSRRRIHPSRRHGAHPRRATLLHDHMRRNDSSTGTVCAESLTRSHR